MGPCPIVRLQLDVLEQGRDKRCAKPILLLFTLPFEVWLAFIFLYVRDLPFVGGLGFLPDGFFQYLLSSLLFQELVCCLLLHALLHVFTVFDRPSGPPGAILADAPIVGMECWQPAFFFLAEEADVPAIFNTPFIRCIAHLCLGHQRGFLV